MVPWPAMMARSSNGGDGMHASIAREMHRMVERFRVIHSMQDYAGPQVPAICHFK